jgi:hypothetical protein
MNDVINVHPAEAVFPTGDATAPSRGAEAKFRVGDAMRRWCLQLLGPKLKAVILTGSLARNEATWREVDGTIDFLSDAEFVVILHEWADLPWNEAATLISRGAEEELRNVGISCKLSLGAVHESYLSRLGETIFGFELLTCGEVLYGDPKLLLSRAPHADIQVTLEDGWRMLANRTVELLEILPELAAGKALLSDAAQYRLTKLYLDLATSLLVFKREFVAGYQARADRLRELQERDALGDLPFNADQFIEIVCHCAAYKITSMWTGASPFAERKCVGRAIADLLNLWSWELAQMSSTEIGSPDSLLRLHMRNQCMKARLRGWLFAVRREGMVAALHHGLRWFALFRIASPRYCVYAAALNIWNTVQLDDSQNLGVDLGAAGRWLPVVRRTDAPVRNDITGVVSTILWNYLEFLVETRS